MTEFFCWLSGLAVATLLIFAPACVPAGQESANGNDNVNAATDNSDVRDSLDNRAPTAFAGADFSASAGDEVSLDARGSADPDGDQLGFFWSQTSGDVDIEFSSSPFNAIVTFSVPDDLIETTVVTFTVAVGDDFVAAFDEISITLSP